MLKNIALFTTLMGLKQMDSIMKLAYFSLVVLPEKRKDELDECQSLLKPYGVKVLIQPFDSSSKSYFDLVDSFLKNKINFIFSNCYSMKIGEDLLSFVNFNAFNCHWSLLPLNRGPNPVQWTIIKGEKETGVTIHKMSDTFDAGDIVFQSNVEILHTDTWLTLSDKLMRESSRLIEANWDNLIEGRFELIKQPRKTSANKRINQDYPEIRFDEMTDLEVYNLIRAQVKPLRGAFYFESGRKKYISNFMTLDQVIELRGRMKC